jgi:hypothetical protein
MIVTKQSAEPAGDQQLSNSIAAAFTLLSALTESRERGATYIVVEGERRRVVGIEEFRTALTTSRRLEVSRDGDESDLYVCSQ